MRRSERLKGLADQSPVAQSDERGKLRARVGQLEAENEKLKQQYSDLVETQQELKENHRALVDEHKNCPAEKQSSSCAANGPTAGSTPKRSLDDNGAKILRQIVHHLELDSPQLGLGLEGKISVIRSLFERFDYAFPESRAAEIIGQANTEVHQRVMREIEGDVNELRNQIEQLRQRKCKQCPQLEKQIGDLKEKCDQLANCGQCEQFKKERDEKQQNLIKSISESLELRKQKRQIETEANGQRQKCADLGKQYDLLNSELHTLRKHMGKQREKIAQLEDELKNNKRRCEVMEEELKQLNQNNKNSGTELEQYRELNGKLTADLEKLVGQVSELEQELLEEEARKGEARLMLKNRTEERDDLRADLQQLEDYKGKLLEQKTKLDDGMAKLERDKRILEEDHLELKKLHAQLGEDKANLEASLADHQQQIEQLREEKAQMEYDISQYFDGKQNQSFDLELGEPTMRHMADERGKTVAELEAQNQYLLDQQKIAELEAEMDTLKEANRQLAQKLKEKSNKIHTDSKLLQYENDAKQRINDVVEKKRALDQALLLFNQTGRRLDQLEKEQREKEAQQRMATTVGTQTNNSGTVGIHSTAPLPTHPSHAPLQLSTMPTTSASLFTKHATDTDIESPSPAGVDQSNCQKCSILRRRLFEAKQYTKHLAGAVSFLLADPSYGAEAARMGPRPGTSGGDGGGAPKRQRTE